MVWDGVRWERVQRFVLFIFVGLGAVHVLQILVAIFFGPDAHTAVFVLEREHWVRMWTPFTSALAHAPGAHLTNNLTGFLIFAPPLAAAVGAARAIGILYAGAVLGQLIGVASGKGDLLGASAGVMTAASASVVVAPLWINHLRAWARNAWSLVEESLAHDRYQDAWLVGGALLVAIAYPGILVYFAGISFKSDLQGASVFATYPWGSAPPGPGYTSHLFGFAFGAVTGLVILAWAAWQRWGPPARTAGTAAN